MKILLQTGIKHLTYIWVFYWLVNKDQSRTLDKIFKTFQPSLTAGPCIFGVFFFYNWRIPVPEIIWKRHNLVSGQLQKNMWPSWAVYLSPHLVKCTGQRIPCFDSCQLTIILWNFIIKDNQGELHTCSMIFNLHQCESFCTVLHLNCTSELSIFPCALLVMVIGLSGVQFRE